MATTFTPRKTTRTPSPSQVVSPSNRVPYSPRAFQEAATVTSSTVPPSAGPDYQSLFLDPQKEATHRKKKYDDWDREMGALKRNGQTFPEMIRDEFELDVEITMEDDNDAAVIFAHEGDIDKLKWCIDMGADLSFINSGGLTALEAAAKNGKNDVIIFLIDEVGLNPNKRSRNLPLTMAGIGGHESTIKLLIEKGAWLSGTDRNDNTVLHQLLLKFHVDTASNIIDFYTAFKNPKANEIFDFNVISVRNKTILFAAMHCIGYKHTTFHAEKPDYNMLELRERIQPAIELCRKIKSISGLPYGRPTAYRGRESYAPVREYTRLSNPESVKGYIGELYRVAPEFVREIIAEQTHSQHNDDFAAFYRTFAGLEITAVSRAIRS